jgi:Rps23 Pro-64 3,4-dihydroxylase Tpa1-like proline 4-hydroxylase
MAENAEPAVSGAAEPQFRLAVPVDPAVMASVYGRLGRVLMPDMFDPETARALYKCLTEEIPWQLHFNGSEGVYDLTERQLAELDAEARAKLMAAVHTGAKGGFQFLYRNYPLSDEYAAGRGREYLVARAFEFLSSPTFLDFARKVTGVAAIDTIDAQATCYGPGHFLTQHDDLAEDKNRVAAYVIGMTPVWRTDWGGLLNFIARGGHVAEAYAPTFNTLTIFRVPQAHSVSLVAPFAGYGRYSISGWLRTGQG